MMVFSVGYSRAQDMPANIFSIYSGIYSTVVNPALMTGSKAYLDVNIAGATVFAENDWGFIPRQDINIWGLLAGDTLTPRYGNYKHNGVYRYFSNRDKKFLSVASRITGPSVMLQSGNHAFGLSFSARSFTGGYNIPYEIPVLFYEGLSYKALQDTVFDDYNFNFTSSAWAEAALSWAHDFKRMYKSKLTFGATAKYLLVYEGIYAANKHAKYMVLDKDTIDIYNYTSEFGLSLPLDYESKSPEMTGPFFKGFGMGFDVGIVYTRLKSSVHPSFKPRLCSNPYEDYIYRIGVSLLDIGNIWMNKHAMKHNFNNVSALWPGLDTLDFLGINGNLREMSFKFYGDSSASLTGNKFSFGLPAAISVQLEIHPFESFYVSGLWMQALQFEGKQLRRPSQIAVTPRYETDYLALHLTASVIEYRYARLGAAIRLGPLTVGSERLGILLGLANLDGVDAYVSLKFGLNKGRCSDTKRDACYNENFK